MFEFLKTAINRLQGKSERDVNKVWFTKDSTGQWWFLGIYSNKYMDRDGEIIPAEGHKEYIEWLKRTGFKPMITMYHQPQMPFGFWNLIFTKFSDEGEKLNQIVADVFKDFGFARAEHVTYMNGFTIVAAKVLPGREEIAERLSKKKDFGMSHGFIVLDANGIYLNKYRSFEMSVLRSNRAANLLTRSNLLEGDAMKKQKQKGLAPADRADLVEIFGEEVISKLESQTGESEPILDKLLAHKSALMGQSEKTAEETPVPKEDEKAKMPMDDDEEEDEDKEDEKAIADPVAVLAKEVAEVLSGLQPVLAEMQSKIKSLEDQNKALRAELAKKADASEVKELKKTEDEKIADQFLPRIDWRAGYSATKADETVITDEQKKDLIKSGPGATPGKTFLDTVLWEPLQKGFSNGGQG